MKKKVNQSTLVFLSLVSLITSCSTSVKLQVPAAFAEQSTVMHVKGSKGSGFSKKLSFGEYTSTDLDRGWKFSSSVRDKSTFFSFENTVLPLFNIEKWDYTAKEKNKYQYSLHRNNHFTIIYCKEYTATNSTRISTLKIGEINTAKRQWYNFAAAIISDTVNGEKPWFLTMNYDQEMKGGGIASFINQGFPVEKGYITNQTDTIVIKPVFVSKTANENKNKESRLPFEIVGGYEFRIGDGVVGIVDVIHHDIWLYNDMPEKLKIIIASGASAILLRSGKSG